LRARSGAGVDHRPNRIGASRAAAPDARTRRVAPSGSARDLPTLGNPRRRSDRARRQRE
jgi:hypothetical protein